MQRTKKKSKKGLVIGIIVAIIVLSFIAVPMIMSGKGNSFAKAVTTKSDIKTYYTFTGNVESKSTQQVFSDKIMQISNIYFEEGDLVKKDDVLFKTKQGDKIISKISGTIQTLYVEDEQSVMAGTKLCDIVDYENLKITIKIDEYDLASIEENKNVDVTIGAIDKTVKGVISSISDTATNQNNVAYFTATVDIPKVDKMKVGMTAEASLLNKSVNSALVIPMSAIQFTDKNEPFVYIAGEKGAMIKRNITVGINDGKIVEIKTGLTDGQKIFYPDTKSSTKTNQGFMPPRPSIG